MNTVIELVSTQSWFGVVTAAIALASAVTAITPTPKQGTPLSKVYKVIEFLALNVGKAKDTGKK